MKKGDSVKEKHAGYWLLDTGYWILDACCVLWDFGGGFMGVAI